MQLIRATSTAAFACSLLFAHHVSAQSDSTNQNITLRFFKDNQESSCDYSNSSGALTFTTASIPVRDYCFDLEDLFNGNATQGFVNQTGNLGYIQPGRAGIHWQLENVDMFDSQANYSKILYRQHIANPSTEDQKPGHFASRRATLYGGKGCSEKDPLDNSTLGLLPWYGFSCWSMDSGSCGTMPYNLASFRIYAGPDEKNQHGTCWAFAEMGASAHVYPPLKLITGAIVSVSLALGLFW